MYTFINRYTEHPVRLHYVKKDDSGDKQEVNTRIVFRNAIFQTEDDAIAQALRTHPYFGTDWFEKENIKEKANSFRHAEDQDLYNRLNSLSYPQLKNVAFEKKIAQYKETHDGKKSLNKMKKEELILLMMEKRHNLGEYFME